MGMSLDADVSGAKLNSRVSSDNLARCSAAQRESTQDLSTRKRDIPILIAYRRPGLLRLQRSQYPTRKALWAFRGTERREARTGHACGERLEWMWLCRRSFPENCSRPMTLTHHSEFALAHPWRSGISYSTLWLSLDSDTWTLSRATLETCLSMGRQLTRPVIV